MAAALHASVDGRIGAPAEAMIPVTDDGLLRGDGVFEAIKLYDGHPFRLAEHLDRLEDSARALRLDAQRETLEREVPPLLERAGAVEAMLRVVVTRGGRRILLVEELPAWPPTVDVALVRLSPSELLAGVKSISYAANMLATRLAAERGSSEAVYLDRDGTVLEAPTSSVFWAGGDGRLRTPGLGTGILDSITRRVLVGDLDVKEGSFPASELRGAREAFLASTTREIQPIATVDGEPLPAAGGGELCRLAARTLADAVERERRHE